MYESVGAKKWPFHPILRWHERTLVPKHIPRERLPREGPKFVLPWYFQPQGLPIGIIQSPRIVFDRSEHA